MSGFDRDADLPAPVEIATTFKLAVDVLHGSVWNHVLCCGAMATSFGFTVVGYVIMAEGDPCALSTPIITLVFVISQAFVFTKTSRDQKLLNAAGGFAGDASRPLSMAQKLQIPTNAYRAQVLLFFILALASAVYSLIQLKIESKIDDAWLGFAGLALLWTVVATLCLSKSARDRRDADEWAKVPPHQQVAELEHILPLCGGTLEYQALVWVAFPIAVLFTLAWIWFGKADLAIERKGFLTLAIIFNGTCSFHIAKLVRDRAQKQEAKKLQNQIPFQIMVVASFVISVVVPFVAVCIMPLKSEERLFLMVGQLMTTNTALNLAKLVRDRIEVKFLRTQEVIPEPTLVEPVRMA